MVTVLNAMYTKKEINSEKKCSIQAVGVTESVHYDFQVDKCVNWVIKHGASKVCVQFPPDMLHLSVEVVHALEDKLKQKLYILGDTFYGNCCVDVVAAQHINADAIIHFGHACLSPLDNIPVLYIFPKKPIDVCRFCVCFEERFDNSEHVLLLYDVSYHHAINDISNYLKSNYKHLIIPSLIYEEHNFQSTAYNLFGRLFTLSDGITLCSVKVVFLGSDSICATHFKYLMPKSEFYLYNPDRNFNFELYNVNIGKFLRKRMFLIETLKEVKSIGILIGTLHVTNYLEAVKRIKSLTKSKGIKCYIISVGTPTVSKLSNFPQMDAYVMISCTENTLLDSKEFMQPIVTPYEVELAFNDAYTWSEKYITDYNALLPGGKYHVAEEHNAANETNVSLVSGLLSRSLFEMDTDNSQSSDLITKAPGSVVCSESHGANYLANRSWTGLEVQLGLTDVHIAVVGRSGIPTVYENENS